MAASGGHWVKGSFIPAEGGAGDLDTSKGYVRPENLAQLQALMDSGEANPYGEFAFFYDPRTRDLVFSVEGYHDDLERDLGHPPGWMDTQVHGVIKGLQEGREPSLFFRTTGAGHAAMGDTASSRAVYDPTDRDIDRQWRNIYKAARAMGKFGMKDSAEVVVDEYIPRGNRDARNTGSRIVRTSVGAASG